MSDARAAQAREAHRLSREAVGQAERHREQRNRLIRQLRAEDPDRWSYGAIAKAVGISPEMAAAIVKGRTGTPC